jgi:hypothetical protein
MVSWLHREVLVSCLQTIDMHAWMVLSITLPREEPKNDAFAQALLQQEPLLLLGDAVFPASWAWEHAQWTNLVC